MSPALKRAIGKVIGHATGAAFQDFSTREIAGGCINQTQVLTQNGRSYFLKRNAASPSGMFEAEQEALLAIAATGAIRVPQPIVPGTARGVSFLAMEYLALGSGHDAAWRTFGQQLAALHRHTSPDGRFGWPHQNFIGSTPQPNPWHADWPSFWRTARLGHMLQLTTAAGFRFANANRLLNGLDAFFEGHHPAPSLLHGDLWGGNVAFVSGGIPVIYDPAAYYGDRETDLANTRLFGAFFPSAFYDAYETAFPLPSGHEQRRDLYNLYHILNHANLGAPYRHQAQSLITALARQV